MSDAKQALIDEAETLLNDALALRKEAAVVMEISTSPKATEYAARLQRQARAKENEAERLMKEAKAK